MKIAVVCANGRVGRLVVKEAIDRGLDVTAIAKGENESAAEKYICKDLFDLTTKDLEDYDVIVDAFGAWEEKLLPLHSKSLQHLCDILSGTEKRLVIVGGAGSLYVNKEHTAVVSDGPDFPPQFLPLAKAQGKALTELRERYAIIHGDEFSCLEFHMNRDTINWIRKKLNTGGRYGKIKETYP